MSISYEPAKHARDLLPDEENEQDEHDQLDAAQPAVDVVALWRQLQDRAFCSAQLPGDKTGGKTGDPVEDLARSSDETEQRAADKLKALAGSDSETDKADAARLTKMLTNDKERALALSLLTNIQDDAVRHQFFAIADDPKQAAAAQKLTDLLVTSPDKQIDAPQSVASLLSRLSGDDKQQQADAKELLAMLNDPAKQADAAQLLQSFAYDAGLLHTALQMKNDPERQKDFDEIMSLLKSDKGFDANAGVAMLRMFGDSDATVSSDRQTLMTMLKDAKTRTAAIDIAAGLESPQHVHQMLELLKDPTQKRATDRLLAMLHHADGELPDRVAQQLLGLLTDKFEPEKGDGQRLLKLFNSEKAEERYSAEKLMRTVGDAEHRHELLKFVEDSITRPGVDRLLELAGSGRRRDREKWQDVIGKLDGTGSVQDKIGRQVVTLLAGDEKQQAAVKTIITRLQSDQEQSRILSILSEPKTKDAGQKLLDWLEGDQTQRSAAMNFLNLNVAVQESGFNLGRRQELPSIREPHPVTEQILPMLTDDKDKAATAMTLLTQVGSPAQIKMVIDGLNKPELKAGCEEVLKMLGSKDQADQHAAKQLLEMIEPPLQPRNELRALAVGGGRERKEGEFDPSGIRLLQMLGDPKGTATAKTILTLESRGARASLQDMLDSPSRKELGERVLKLMAEKGSTSVAEEMLSRFSFRAEELKVALDLMDQAKAEEKAEKKTPGVAAFNYMMRDKNEGAIQVAKMLGSYEPEERKIGQQMLEKLTGRERWDTQTLLTLGLYPKAMQEFQALMSDRNTRAAAYALQGLLQSDNREVKESAKALANSLSYADSKKDALYLINMLNPSNKEQQALAMGLLSSGGDAREILRISKALQDPAERKAAEALIGLLNTTRGEGGFGLSPARSLLLSLSFEGGRPRDDMSATRLFRMLGDEKKAPLAESLIRNLPTFEDQKAALNLIEPGASAPKEQQDIARAVSELALSKERTDQVALARLMELMPDRRIGAAPPAVSQNLLKMLADPAKRADAVAILSRFENARQCADFVQMMSGKATEPAAKAMLDLLKSARSEDAQGVVEVFKRIDDSKRFGNARGGAPEPLPGQTEQLFKALGDPATVENAKKALQLIQKEDSIDAVVNLLSTEAGKADLEKLHAMRLSKDDEQRRLAFGIAGLRSAAEIHLVLQMLADEKQKEAAHDLVNMANDTEDATSLRAGRNVLQLLTSTNPADQKAGERLLSMIRTGETRDAGRLLASRLRANSIRPILDIFADEKTQYAAGEIEELLKDEDNGDRQAVEKLAGMLGSMVPSQVKEGQRLLAMLNDPSSKYTAIRILRRGTGGGLFSGN